MGVCVVTQPEGPFSVDNSGWGVEERLVEPITGTKRKGAVDSWFKTIPLSEKLLLDHISWYCKKK